jgi:hypothetical protein
LQRITEAGLAEAFQVISDSPLIGLPDRTTLRTLGTVVEGTPQHFIKERQFTGSARVLDRHTSPSCFWANRHRQGAFPKLVHRLSGLASEQEIVVGREQLLKEVEA